MTDKNVERILQRIDTANLIVLLLDKGVFLDWDSNDQEVYLFSYDNHHVRVTNLMYQTYLDPIQVSHYHIPIFIQLSRWCQGLEATSLESLRPFLGDALGYETTEFKDAVAILSLAGYPR